MAGRAVGNVFALAVFFRGLCPGRFQENKRMNMQISFVNWVTSARYAELSGLSEAGVRHRIESGLWAEGVQWKWDNAARQMVNISEVDKWVANSTSKGSRRGKRPSSSTCAAAG